MKLTIAEKFCPFSHTPGASCLVPGTWWSVQAFPTRLRFSCRDQCIEVSLRLTGPVEQFTLEQDLEKKVIRIFGRAKEGYFRLRLTASPEGLFLCAEKTPPGGLFTSLGVLQAKESFLLPIEWIFYQPPHLERLSLGSHKEQNWDAVLRRLDLREMLPLLLYLAQHVPPAKINASLFSLDKADAISQLTSFVKAHCINILVPRVEDERYQGISFAGIEKNSEPCALLHDAAQWIRSLFITVSKEQVHILPHLPQEFACGRFLHVSLGLWGCLDMEWTSSFLRKAVLKATASSELVFTWPKNVVSFRVRTNRFEKGRCQKITEPFMVKAGTTYFLDHFES